jgi:hypothetical protein
MANPEHLQILRQGVAAWNQWRCQNQSIRPERTDTALYGADLRTMVWISYRSTRLRILPIPGTACSRDNAWGSCYTLALFFGAMGG